MPKVAKNTKGRDFRVTAIISAREARTHLGEILERAMKSQERFLINRNGKAAAVIMGVEDYLQNVIEQPEVLTRLEEQARLAGSDEMSLERRSMPRSRL